MLNEGELQSRGICKLDGVGTSLKVKIDLWYWEPYWLITLTEAVLIEIAGHSICFNLAINFTSHASEGKYCGYI